MRVRRARAGVPGGSSRRAPVELGAIAPLRSRIPSGPLSLLCLPIGASAPAGRSCRLNAATKSLSRRLLGVHLPFTASAQVIDDRAALERGSGDPIERFSLRTGAQGARLPRRGALFGNALKRCTPSLVRSGARQPDVVPDTGNYLAARLCNEVCAFRLGSADLLVAAGSRRHG